METVGRPQTPGQDNATEIENCSALHFADPRPTLIQPEPECTGRDSYLYYFGGSFLISMLGFLNEYHSSITCTKTLF